MSAPVGGALKASAGGGPSARGEHPLEVRRLGRLGYAEGLALQARLLAERRAGRVPDLLLLLEHPHVITLGSAAEPGHVLVGEEERRRLGIELFETGRGGDVTYHGPGQLVGYPILALEPGRRDLHRYLRDLETVLIEGLGSLGVDAHRSAGRTGVWTRGGKIGAIGVRVSSGWITSHGFAVNVSTDLRYFTTIVPCGLDDARVTSVERELGETVSAEAVMDALVIAFLKTFGRALTASEPS